jgi:hypothetical protein
MVGSDLGRIEQPPAQHEQLWRDELITLCTGGSFGGASVDNFSVMVSADLTGGSSAGSSCP